MLDFVATNDILDNQEFDEGITIFDLKYFCMLLTTDDRFRPNCQPKNICEILQCIEWIQF